MVTGSVKERPFGFKMVGHAPKQGYVELDVFVDSLSNMDQWLDVINNGLKANKRMAREAFMAEMDTTKGVLGFSFAGTTSKQQVKELKSRKSDYIHEALQQIEMAKSAGSAACDEIVAQGEQLGKVEQNLSNIESDLNHSEKLIKSIRHPLRYFFSKTHHHEKDAMSKNNTNHRSHHHQTGILHMRKNDGKIEHVAEEICVPTNDLEKLAMALKELEVQAQLINSEAVKSNDQITRIEGQLSGINDRIQSQTTQVVASSGKKNLF
ncbi:unnamed protein product [Albugo candida]|nr:unnamed protein product [Albugo candida]|eukprot:CCI45124.1 unnamed protein product [Albugo candida]